MDEQETVEDNVDLALASLIYAKKELEGLKVEGRKACSCQIPVAQEHNQLEIRCLHEVTLISRFSGWSISVLQSAAMQIPAAGATSLGLLPRDKMQAAYWAVWTGTARLESIASETLSLGFDHLRLLFCFFVTAAHGSVDLYGHFSMVPHFRLLVCPLVISVIEKRQIWQS